MAKNGRTEAELLSILREALEAGSVAGRARVRELAAYPVQAGKMLESCGGSILSLQVDGRTGLGRLIGNINTPGISVRKDLGGGFILHLAYVVPMVAPVNGQEWSISHDANEAAADVLRQRLGIQVYARAYMD